MRDRLMELISQVQYMGGLEAKLADHLLANGVIVPPLRVGQTVYYCNYYLGGVFAYRISDVCLGYYGEGEIYWGAACFNEEIDELLDCLNFGLDYIGKTVFLTREEAEKALAERSENEK